MIEMIKEDSYFTTKLDDKEYRCRVSCKIGEGFSTRITLFIKKIVRFKFLFIECNKTEWEYVYHLGTNRLLDIFGNSNREIPFEWINHTRYFNPDVIKSKIPSAINSYLYNERKKEEDKIKAAKIKHKKVL